MTSGTRPSWTTSFRPAYDSAMQDDTREQFAGNNAINDEIHELLASFTEPSRSRMRKKIRQDGTAARKYGTDGTDENARHTFREFLAAHELNRLGFGLEYNRKIEQLTPDWYDESNGLLLEVFTCERGGKSDPGCRIAETITDKVLKYTDIVRKNSLAFLIAVYGDFLSFLNAEDCEQAIKDNRLFERYLDLSGVMFFTETTVLLLNQEDGARRRKQDYGFEFFENLQADRPIPLPTIRAL